MLTFNPANIAPMHMGMITALSDLNINLGILASSLGEVGVALTQTESQIIGFLEQQVNLDDSFQPLVDIWTNANQSLESVVEQIYHIGHQVPDLINKYTHLNEFGLFIPVVIQIVIAIPLLVCAVLLIMEASQRRLFSLSGNDTYKGRQFMHG